MITDYKRILTSQASILFLFVLQILWFLNIDLEHCSCKKNKMKINENNADPMFNKLHEWRGIYTVAAALMLHFPTIV